MCTFTVAPACQMGPKPGLTFGVSFKLKLWNSCYIFCWCIWMYSNVWCILIYIDLHLKRGHFKRKGSSSNHYFSGWLGHRMPSLTATVPGTCRSRSAGHLGVVCKGLRGGQLDRWISGSAVWTIKNSNFFFGWIILEHRRNLTITEDWRCNIVNIECRFLWSVPKIGPGLYYSKDNESIEKVCTCYFGPVFLENCSQ